MNCHKCFLETRNASSSNDNDTIVPSTCSPSPTPSMAQSHGYRSILVSFHHASYIGHLEELHLRPRQLPLRYGIIANTFDMSFLAGSACRQPLIAAVLPQPATVASRDIALRGFVDRRPGWFKFLRRALKHVEAPEMIGLASNKQ